MKFDTMQIERMESGVLRSEGSQPQRLRRVLRGRRPAKLLRDIVSKRVMAGDEIIRNCTEYHADRFTRRSRPFVRVIRFGARSRRCHSRISELERSDERFLLQGRVGSSCSAP